MNQSTASNRYSMCLWTNNTRTIINASHNYIITQQTRPVKARWLVRTIIIMLREAEKEVRDDIQ